MTRYQRGEPPPSISERSRNIDVPDIDGMVRSGVLANYWDLGSCGVGSLSRFSYMRQAPRDWTEKAEFMSEIYKYLYSPGMVLYSLADHGAGLIGGEWFQELVLPIGAHKIHEYPNQCHLPGTIQLWMVNIRNAVNYYCDIYGDPLPEPPTNYVPHEFKVDHGLAYLPRKP